jgi:hypothetical protein
MRINVIQNIKDKIPLLHSTVDLIDDISDNKTNILSLNASIEAARGRNLWQRHCCGCRRSWKSGRKFTFKLKGAKKKDLQKLQKFLKKYEDDFSSLRKKILQNIPSGK